MADGKCIKERLRELAGDALGIEKGAIKDDTVLFGDHADRETATEQPLGDSLDRVEFILMVEEDFGVSIPDADTKGLATIDQLAAWLGDANPASAHD